MMRRLALALLPLVVVVALVEFTLRTTHLFNARLAWTEPDREIGWRFTPGREYWFHAENDRAVTGKINSSGWRDRERERRKPGGVRRAAVIGDSYVEAFQVELDSTFTAIAERRLVSSGARWEVLNFGRSGMSPAEAAIVLERDVLAFDPDEVVFVFTPHNDVADVNPATAAAGARPFVSWSGDSLVFDRSFAETRGFRMRERINPLKQRLALVSLVTERYNAWRQARVAAARRGTARDGAPALTREQSLCTAHPDAVFTSNYTLCKSLIERMAQACARRGAGFAVLAVPLVYERETEARLRGVDATFSMRFFDEDLAAMADSSGFGVAPLTEAFAGRHAATGAPLYWVHWNYAGHREAGRVLGDLLAASGAPAEPERGP